MEGRETGQNIHPRSYYDVVNTHGHSSSSLHTSSLSHEGLQYPLHASHGMQQMYPFGGRWSNYSPGHVSSSSEISTPTPSTSQNSSTKQSSANLSSSTSTTTGTTQSWWGTPPVYPGISNSDLHPFSSMSWNTHGHHEALSSTREGFGSSYHGSHMRMANGLLSSSVHGHTSTGHSHTSSGHGHSSSAHSHSSSGHGHAPSGHSHTSSGHSHGPSGQSHASSGHSHATSGHSHASSGHSHVASGHSHAPSGHSHAPSGHSRTSSGYGHAYHRPHGNQFQSSTLIHFPHTSSHQLSPLKEDQPRVSSSSDPLSHTSSSNVSAEHSQYLKNRPKKLVKDDPLLSAATDVRERPHQRKQPTGTMSALFKEKELLEDIDLYKIDEEMSSMEDPDRVKHKPKGHPLDRPHSSISEVTKKEKAPFPPEMSSDKAHHKLHSLHQTIPDWKPKHDRKLVQESHSGNCTRYSRSLHVEHPPGNSPKASSIPEESHVARSYHPKESTYPSYSYTSSEREKMPHMHGMISHKSYLQSDLQHIKQDAHRSHSSRDSSPTHRQTTANSLHSDRIARAQATQDWVNQHPSMHTESPEQSTRTKYDHKTKIPETEEKFSSPFDKKVDYMQPSNKSTGINHIEKPAKREPHYESPLNSSLPRYSASSKISKPSSPKVHSKPPPESRHTPPRYQQNKHPFNVDFLSVSANLEKKPAHESDDQRQGYGKDAMKPSDRVSVIKTMPTIPGLKKDAPDSFLGGEARSQISSPRMFEHARYGLNKKPSSLLDTPLPSKKPAGVAIRDILPSAPGEISSQNSDSGSSSSEDDSINEDDIGDEEGDMVIDIPEGQDNANQNGTENEDEETEDGSEDESGNRSDADDSAESGSGSESDENDSQSQSTQEDNASLLESTPEKRKADFDGRKEPKRRKVVDENLIKIPLDQGWKRQTKIKTTVNGDGLRGDVYYFAPCGKKVRTYPEVTKYLERNEITDLGLENFSFSTKTTVGEFLESTQGSKFEVLSEDEVMRRYNLDKERQIERFEKMSKKRTKKKQKAATTRRVQQVRGRRKFDKQAAVEEARISKRRMKVMTAQQKRKREDERQSREIERLQKVEQLRMEKEMRARSIQQEKIHKQERIRIEKEMRQRALHEARRSKKEALQHAKMEEAMRKARERELKRQQTVILKQQEKERRKQHLMMIRALESQRKAEERERKKEEKRLEKRMLKQRKMEQRRYERTIARELKKPVDDMVINDGKPLPEFKRIKGVNIPGQAYADLLMVEEFVYCFGHVLDIDPETDFPGLADLQSALLNESSNEDALFIACESLLSVALHDPGVLAKTKLGVNLQSVELSEANVSEVVRLFILATNENKPHELSDLLNDKPIHSLSPVKKAAILAFLVNELLCSHKIYNEMENCLEHMSNLRRDKWNMEGRIRKLKADLKAKKTEEGIQKEPEEKASKLKQKPLLKKVLAHDDEASNTSLIKDDAEDDEEEDEEDDDEDEEKDEDDKDSDDEEDQDDDDDAGEDAQEEDDSEDTDDETEPTTVEEIEKRINRLEKKHSKYRHKLFTASHTLRGLNLGQDRFKRRYHILPHAGGVFIDGMESSELHDDAGIKNENIKEESGRKRTNSSSCNSDSNLTPVSDSKKLSLILPSPIEVPNNSECSAFKSPNMVSPVLSPGIKCPNQGISPRNSQDRQHAQPNFSEKHGLLSPTRHSGMVSPLGFRQNASKWFSLFPQKACDETSLTRSSIVMPSVNRGRTFIPPNAKLLSQDRRFMDSISNRHIGLPGHGPNYPGFPYNNAPSNHFQGKGIYPSGQDGRMPGYHEENSRPRGPTLPGTDLDIQKLIEQDPQKAAVLLDLQSLEPLPVPEDKRYGWWRISDPDMVHKVLKVLNPRGMREKMLQKSLIRHIDYACSSCKKDKQAFSVEHQGEEEHKDSETLKSPKKEKNKGIKSSPPGKIEDKCFPQVAFSVDKDLLMEVEELEEKMFSASLQNKTWRLSQKASSNISYVKKESKLKAEEKPLELAKARILSLERGIERRYLKPPFRLEKHPNQAQVSKNNGENAQGGADGQPQSSDKDWRITPSLLLWRETVEGCTSSAQLVMCISMLKDCIAWERSIMKVFCIECRKGDNEELLLLCDQCDRGCHTYCCSPKLERIPDGDWFCRECIMIASGSDQCYGCQSSTGRRLKCEFCPRYYHLQCVDPPLQKTPRSPWACPVCKKARLKNKRPTKKKKRPEDEFESLSALEKYEFPTKANTSRSKKEKMNSRKKAMKHMAPCRQMLAEMERHECSWPFLVPVNGKQFPEYYQIIKSPMDFHTMKVKLRDFQYDSREEFANDARLVFRNCDIFNEDDSEVGQAGKRMLKFFEKRWVYIVTNDAQEKSKSAESDSDENGSSQLDSDVDAE